MGNTLGVLSSLFSGSALEPKSSLFITENLTHGVELMTFNSQARAAFIAFIQSNAWMDAIVMDFTQFMPFFTLSSGRKMEAGDKKSGDASTSMSSSASAPAPPTGLTVDFLRPDAIGPLLFAALWPKFLRSPGFRTWLGSSADGVVFDAQDTFGQASNRRPSADDSVFDSYRRIHASSPCKRSSQQRFLKMNQTTTTDNSTKYRSRSQPYVGTIDDVSDSSVLHSRSSSDPSIHQALSISVDHRDREPALCTVVEEGGGSAPASPKHAPSELFDTTEPLAPSDVHTHNDIIPAAKDVGTDVAHRAHVISRAMEYRNHLHDALTAAQKANLDLLLTGDAWLQSLVAYLDDLPVSISLCDASQPGFPLVYVNKYFTQLTQYSKHEVLGKPCSLLQDPHRTEGLQICKISAALKNREMIKVAITNVKKNQQPFLNLLTVKPIVDGEGVFRYVLGVQFDLNASCDVCKDLQMINAVVTLLPNVFY